MDNFKYFLTVALTLSCFFNTMAENDYNILLEKQDIPFDSDTGMDGYTAFKFYDSIDIPIKELTLNDVTEFAPMVLHVVYKPIDYRKSTIFSIVNKERKEYFGVNLKATDAETKIDLILPEKTFTRTFKGGVGTWANVLWFIKESGLIEFYVNCTQPFIEKEDNDIYLSPDDGIKFDDESTLFLGHSGKGDNFFKGIVQNIKLYSDTNAETVKTICTKDEIFPDNTGSKVSRKHDNPIAQALVAQFSSPGFPEKKGEPGAKGEKGDKGSSIKGPQGPPGPQGPQGVTGPTGKNGETGTCSCSEDTVSRLIKTMPEMRGPQGPPGTNGKDGLPGRDGLPGNKGETGEMGPKGNTGEKGPRGDNGVPGKDGTPGSPGEKGRAGAPGAPGPGYMGPEKTNEVPIPGPKGEEGPRGPPGPIGANGEPGKRGDKGEIGEKGDRGLDGAKGDRGDKGTPGNDGAPGEPGTDGISIKGEKGDIGVKGEAGTPGKISDLLDPKMDPRDKEQVVQMVRGLKGERGIDGINGDKGQKGDQGVPGRQGQKGETGPRGPHGPRGVSGEKGEKGDGSGSLPNIEKLRGPKGERGLSGNPGPPGPPGICNITQVIGPPGPQGSIGPPGSPGMSIVGPKGEPGGVITTNTFYSYTDKGNPDDDELQPTNTVIYRKITSLIKNTHITPLGTLAFVLQEEQLLIRVKRGWKHVMMGSLLDLAHTSSTPLPKYQSSTNNEYNFIQLSTPKPKSRLNLKRNTYIRITALNEPYSGNILYTSKLEQECYDQAKTSRNIKPFLATDIEHLKYLFNVQYRHSPVLNKFDKLLFESWSSMFNGSGAEFAQNIYSFNGKNVLIDPTWPHKAIWHGGAFNSENPQYDSCDKWRSDSHLKSGIAAPLNSTSNNNYRLLGQQRYPCDSRLIVLCVELGHPQLRRGLRHTQSKHRQHVPRGLH